MTSEQKKLAKKALEAAVAFVREQIAKDAANRYSLRADWELPPVDCSRWCRAFSYDDDLFHIVPEDDRHVRITVRAYESTAENCICDGDSLSPDLPGCLEGAIFHDPWYLRLEAIAMATGIQPTALRALGDAVFGNIILSIRGDGLIARTYYWAVRVFGGLYHRTKHAILAVLLSLGILALSGCAGCAIPGIIDDPVAPPVFERTAP